MLENLVTKNPGIWQNPVPKILGIEISDPVVPASQWVKFSVCGCEPKIITPGHPIHIKSDNKPLRLSIDIIQSLYHKCA